MTDSDCTGLKNHGPSSVQYGCSREGMANRDLIVEGYSKVSAQRDGEILVPSEAEARHSIRAE